MSATPKWWSDSKKQYVSLSDMHTAHLLAAYKKLERGEYRTGPRSEELEPWEEQNLADAFNAEFQKRGVGPYAAPEAE